MEMGQQRGIFLTPNEWWKSVQPELWAQQSRLPRTTANKPLAAASPCHHTAPRAASPQPMRSKTSSKPVPGSASSPASSPRITQYCVGRTPLPQHGSAFWGRIWGFWVEAAVSEPPGADSLLAQGLNHLLLGLLAKRFSTQPSRRTCCHFRVVFDRLSVKPPRIS